MKFQKSLLTATLFAVGSLATISTNAAVTPNSFFDVKINITSVCSVTAASGANDIDFGSYAAGTLATAIDEKSTAVPITVKCSKNAPYVVNLTPSNVDALGAGIMTGPLGAAAEPADTVAYQLTKTTGGAIWGNGGAIGTVGNGVGGIGAGLEAVGNPHIVYAKVTGSTDVRPGDYKDTVTVNVTY